MAPSTNRKSIDLFLAERSNVTESPMSVLILPIQQSAKFTSLSTSNVFEHVGFPRVLLEEVVKATPHGDLVFLEVPRELPFRLGQGVSEGSRKSGFRRRESTNGMVLGDV
jgi:hypothetical protein